MMMYGVHLLLPFPFSLSISVNLSGGIGSNIPEPCHPRRRPGTRNMHIRPIPGTSATAPPRVRPATKMTPLHSPEGRTDERSTYEGGRDVSGPLVEKPPQKDKKNKTTFFSVRTSSETGRVGWYCPACLTHTAGRSKKERNIKKNKVGWDSKRPLMEGAALPFADREHGLGLVRAPGGGHA
jgi:hypothetical protein